MGLFGNSASEQPHVLPGTPPSIDAIILAIEERREQLGHRHGVVDGQWKCPGATVAVVSRESRQVYVMCASETTATAIEQAFKGHVIRCGSRNPIDLKVW